MKLNKIDAPRDIREKLRTPFPSDVVAIKNDKQKSKYIPGETVIDKLNATFGYLGWSWELVKDWISQPPDKLIKTKYENGQKINLSQNQWTYEKQNAVVNVIGKLTVKMEREDGSIYEIVRMAPGSQPLATGVQSDYDMAVKGAHTDALKKAASTFGIALELYRKTPAQSNYFYNVTYESPWTKEEKENHAEDFNYISNFINKFNLTNEQFNQLIVNCFQGGASNLDQVPPEYMDVLIDFLNNVEKQNTNPSTNNENAEGEKQNGN